MIYQAVIKTPSSLAVLDVDGNGNYTIGNGVVGELSSMRAEWMEHQCPDGGTMMPGTRVYQGEKLNHVILSIPYEDPLMMLEALLTGYGLDWTVEVLAPFYKRDSFVPEVDENDEPTGEIVDFVWDKYPSTDLEVFLVDVIDENDVVTRPTLPALMHLFSGTVEMTVPTI